MFWQSMSPVEAEHIVAAFAFELGKVEVPEIRSAVVGQLARVDGGLAAQVAAKLGLPEPPEEPVDDRWPRRRRCPRSVSATPSPRARSPCWPPMASTWWGRNASSSRWANAARWSRCWPRVAGGTLAGGSGGELPVDRSFTTMASVLYDAVVVACGPRSVSTLSNDGYAVHFVTEAYKHLKPIGAYGAGHRPAAHRRNHEPPRRGHRRSQRSIRHHHQGRCRRVAGPLRRGIRRRSRPAPLLGAAHRPGSRLGRGFFCARGGHSVK